MFAAGGECRLAASKTLLGNVAVGVASLAPRDAASCVDAFWKMPHKGNIKSLSQRYLDIDTFSKSLFIKLIKIKRYRLSSLFAQREPRSNSKPIYSYCTLDQYTTQGNF